MEFSSEEEKALANIEDYGIKNRDAVFTITFREGDQYECRYLTGDWEYYEDEPGIPDDKDWFAVDFDQIKVLIPGPNKDPGYDAITILEVRMPIEVSADGEILYKADSK